MTRPETIREAINPPLPPIPEPLPVCRPFPRLARLAVACVIGMGLGLWAATHNIDLNFYLWQLGLHSANDLLLLLTTLILCVVGHEAGHLVAGWATGSSFIAATLGPIRIVRMHGQWRMHKQSFVRSLASISMVASRAEATRVRQIVLTLGGPAANFAIAATAWIVLRDRVVAPIWTHFWNDCAVLNALVAVAAIIPNSPKAAIPNDSRRILELARNDALGRKLVVSSQVIGYVVAGIRPRDYPPELMKDLAKQRFWAHEAAYFSFLIAEWAYDLNDRASGTAWEDRSMELISYCDPATRSTLAAASAFLDLAIREDAEAARHKLAQVLDESLDSDANRHRTRAVRMLV